MADSYNHHEPVVAIIGTGNVATHLCKAFSGIVTLHQVDPHTFEGLPRNPDFVIISVKDTAIESVARNLPPTDAIVAHTSGSIPMSALAECGKQYGVFYPLQTFTKGVKLDYPEIPFFIEGNTPEVAKALAELASMISGNIREADSEARKALHLASVFACNFSNYMISIADTLLKEHGMDHHVLLPLLQQTVAKLTTLSPRDAQTGPAARKDLNVIDAHIKKLTDEGHDDLADIYKILSSQIIKMKS